MREYRVNSIISRVEDEEITSRTAENYVYCLLPFEKFFNTVTVGEVTTVALNQFFKTKSMEKSNKGEYVYSQVTLDRIEFVVHSMFKRAYKKGWLSCDPFDSEDFKKPISKKETVKVEGLDPEELKQVLMVVKKYPIIHAPISLMLNTGMRMQEVLALKWSNVDLKDNTIQVEQALTVEVHFDDNGKVKERKSVIGDTKTEGSVIGLTHEAKKIIQDWMEVAPIISKTKMGDSDFMFGYEEKSNFTYNAFRCRVNDYLARQSGDIDKMRLHRLRHTVGTLLAAEGREVLQIMRQLGITQEKTLQRYIDKKGNKKIMEGNVQAISQGLSEIVGQKVPKESTDNDNSILQTILEQAESLSDSKTKVLISSLLKMVQGL